MDNDKMMKGILPGIIAGYIFLAFVGAGMTNPVATTVAETIMDEAGALTVTAETTVDMTMGNGMLDMVGGMIQSDAFIGFILHIIISAVIGAIYTGFVAQYLNFSDNSIVNIAVGGLIYGLIWWIIGGNIIMPAIAGGDILQLSIGPSFFGHIIFGHVLAYIVINSNGGDDDGE